MTERVSDGVLREIASDAEPWHDYGETVRSMARELIALRAAVAWRPIETAPDNHFPILVSGPHGQMVAFRDVTWAWWPVPASEALNFKPTHWMPLPQKPTKDGGRG